MNRILVKLPETEAKALEAKLKKEFDNKYTFSVRPFPSEDNIWVVMVKQPPSQKLLTFTKGAVAILQD